MRLAFVAKDEKIQGVGYIRSGEGNFMDSLGSLICGHFAPKQWGHIHRNVHIAPELSNLLRNLTKKKSYHWERKFGKQLFRLDRNRIKISDRVSVGDV